MSKIPGVNHLDTVRALQKAGFTIARQGKHIVRRLKTAAKADRARYTCRASYGILTDVSPESEY